MNGETAHGWVYIMRNVAMPGMVKIGKTTLSPEERARQLSIGTGIPSPFFVVGAFATRWPAEAEREVHRQLSYRRVSQNREFFEAQAPDGQHMSSDEDSNAFFALTVECAIEYIDVRMQIELLTAKRFELQEEHERKRQAFLWELMKRNYPQRAEEVLEQFRKLREPDQDST